MKCSENCKCTTTPGNIDYRLRAGKLQVFDWLADQPKSTMFPDIVEVHFKNTRKDYYLNESGTLLQKEDIVAVEGTSGHDVGIVSLTGDLIFEKMRTAGVDYKKLELKKIYRKARQGDIEKWHAAIDREKSTMVRARQLVVDLNLNMKLSDVEFQGDNSKAIFYYIADERVDFRQLIRVLAEEFQIRVEMRQIGSRQEAGLVGGIGSCGRELCCASWMTNFKSVTTGAARKQELSLNPSKLAGQCGKLKCCLNFELEAYLEARKGMPRVDKPLETEVGRAYHFKTDVLKQIMWYTYGNERPGFMAVTVERVKEIIKLNKEGKKAEDLGALDLSSAKEQADSYADIVGQDDLNRFDQTGKKKTHRGRKKGAIKGKAPQERGGQARKKKNVPGQPRANNANQTRNKNRKGAPRKNNSNGKNPQNQA